MVTLDRLPMRDVLVDRLDWAEDDARAFLDVLFAPVENLATKDDVEAVRAEILAVRAELRGEINGVREELEQHIDQRLAELEKRQDERERRMYAEFRSMIRASEVRMMLLFTGGFGALIGIVIDRT